MQLLRRLAVVTMAAATALAGMITATPAHAAPDIYITPGTHNVNGRQWKTTCASYSTTIERCTTTIYGTVITNTGGKYVQTNGWMFNNLTYKANPRATWKGNPLATPGLHTINGREWRVECDTPNVGRNGCRAYIWGTVTGKTGNTYGNITGWQFNNQVRFTDSPAPGTSLYANWVDVDAEISYASDLHQLSELPIAFQSYVSDYLTQLKRGNECEEDVSIWVDRYHGAGYAMGGVSSCSGWVTVWGMRNGRWEEIDGRQEAPECADLERIGLPRDSGWYCYLSYASGVWQDW